MQMTLLYFGDILSLIAPMMSIIKEYDGLMINWHKSFLMPLDPLPSSPESIPLGGIVVSSRPQYCISLNLFPILAKISAKFIPVVVFPYPILVEET